jgi:hypothetical protein
MINYVIFDVALFSEIHLKPYMRFYIKKYDIYRSYCQDGHKGGTAISFKKGVPHSCSDLSLLL